MFISYIYTNILLCTLRVRAVRSFPGAFSFSGALVAQNCSKSPRARPGPLRAAQSCSDLRSGRAQGRSEPLRAAQNRSERAQSRSERAQSRRPERSELLSAAQNRSERAQSRSEPLRVAQSGRSELFEEPLRVAQSAPRAAQRRSESLGACPEPLRAALNRPERSVRAAQKTDRGARCHVHFAYQVLSFA